MTHEVQPSESVHLNSSPSFMIKTIRRVDVLPRDAFEPRTALVRPPALYQTAIWPVDLAQGHVIGRREKNGGRPGQCLCREVRGHGPLTTHVKTGLTHPVSSQ